MDINPYVENKQKWATPKPLGGVGELCVDIYRNLEYNLS